MHSTTAVTVRKLIAGHFGVQVDCVVDETRLCDLGADWLDRLELLIVIEEKLPDFQFSGVLAEQIETGGDLVRAVEDSAIHSGLPAREANYFTAAGQRRG
jgi:acyl carrier protein